VLAATSKKLKGRITKLKYTTASNVASDTIIGGAAVALCIDNVACSKEFMIKSFTCLHHSDRMRV
jgi:hypothetical protein